MAAGRHSPSSGGDFLESLDEIPEPHAFTAFLRLQGPTGGEVHEVVFEEHGHGHDHDHGHMNLGDEDDAHARAHAEDIRRRFHARTVTIGQIVLFGLTCGLIPCPAAITVLLLCIQLKQFSLGFALVVCFGIGLAATMVSAGVLAPSASSTRRAADRGSAPSHAGPLRLGRSHRAGWPLHRLAWLGGHPPRPP